MRIRDHGRHGIGRLAYDITCGDCSGVVKVKSEKVSGKSMVKVLEAQGSRGNFFFMDEEED